MLRLGIRVAWRASFVLGSSDCREQLDSPHTSPEERASVHSQDLKLLCEPS